MIYLSMMTIAVVSFQVDTSLYFPQDQNNDGSLSGSSGASLWLSVKEEADSLAI